MGTVYMFAHRSNNPENIQIERGGNNPSKMIIL